MCAATELPPGERTDVLVERLALVGLVLIGGLVRLGHGVALRPWQAQPDQRAWSMLLAEARRGPLRADQLVHYPHDLGGVVPGLLGLALEPLARPDLPALALSALVVDLVVRLVQVLVADRLFGPRSALCLALWQIVAVPMLLPWATVNVGLHHASSAWPFVLLLVLHGGGSSPVSPWRALGAGALTGLSLAWSTSDLVLVACLPVLLLSAALRRGGAAGARFGVLLAGVLPVGVAAGLLHQVRRGLDLGFHLEGLSTWSVRGEDLSALDAHRLAGRLLSFWIDTLPAGLFSGPWGPGPTWMGRLFVLVAAVGVLLALAQRRSRPVVVDAVVIIGAFTLAWLLSPFSELPQGHRDYFAWRHLAWMLPLLVSVALHGWARWPEAGWTVTGVGAFASLAMVLGGPTRPVPAAHDDAVGWVLGRKLGHDPPRLARLVDPQPVARARGLREGCGWGTVAAAVDFGRAASDAPVDALLALRRRWPLADRPDVDAGMRRGLAEHAPATLAQWRARSWQSGLQIEGPLVKREPDRIAMYGNGRVILAMPVTGPVSLVVSGSTAAGRGPTARVEVDGRVLVEERVGPRRRVLSIPPVAHGARLSLVYDDDLVDDRGHDRDLYLWWVERPASGTVTGE